MAAPSLAITPEAGRPPTLLGANPTPAIDACGHGPVDAGTQPPRSSALTRAPSFPVALFYFAMFTATGVIQSYLPPYYRTLGFGGLQIAALGSIQAVALVAVPPFWGFWADRAGDAARPLRVATAGAVLAFAPLLGVRSFAAVAAILVAVGVFTSPTGGLADAVAVGAARRSGRSFARLRLWGSIGFVASSWLFGVWLDRGGEAADAVPAALGCLAFTALVSLPLRSDGGRSVPPALADARRLIGDPGFLFFLGAAALHWASLSPYHLFFAVHLGDLGIGATWIGAGLAGGVAAEVAVMWFFPALANRFPLYGLLAASSIAGAARWAVTACLDSGPLLAATQLLHGLVFGAFFVGAIAHLARAVPQRLLATGRALFGAVAFGAGGLAGNAVAGVLYDTGGGQLAFAVAAGFELAALPLLFLSARRTRLPA